MKNDVQAIDLKVGNWSLQAIVSGKGHDSWVAMKPLCEALGLDWKTQYRKLQGNPQFNYGHMTTVAEDGKEREMLCIPVEEVAMWICSINAARVTPEIRDKLLVFQRKLQLVLFQAVFGDRAVDLRVGELQSTINDLQQKLQMVLDMVSYLVLGDIRSAFKSGTVAGSALAHHKHGKQERLELLEKIKGVIH